MPHIDNKDLGIPSPLQAKSSSEPRWLTDAQSSLQASGLGNGRRVKAESKREIDFVFQKNETPTAVHERLADFVASQKQSAGLALFEIGRALNEAKKRLDHGQFLKFLQDPKVDLSVRSAQLFMKVAASADGLQLSILGIAKATLLVRLPPAKREGLLSKASECSVAQLKKLCGASAHAAKEAAPSAAVARTFDVDGEARRHVELIELSFERCPVESRQRYKELLQEGLTQMWRDENWQAALIQGILSGKVSLDVLTPVVEAKIKANREAKREFSKSPRNAKQKRRKKTVWIRASQQERTAERCSGGVSLRETPEARAFPGQSKENR